MPYYEMGFKRRLMIRNVTRAEQIMGYDLNTDTKSVKSLKSNSSQNGQNGQKSQKSDCEYKKYLRVK